MRSLAVTLVIVVRACAPSAGNTTGMVTTTTARDEPLRYLALGDSYTIGESVAPQERWPEVLAALLGEAGVPARAEIIARTGWTTAELHAAIDDAALRGPYDLVTLMIGVNDQFRGLDPEGFRGRFATLLDRAIALAEGEDRVIVVTIPDWGVTPFGAGYDREAVATEIDSFNALIVSESAALEVPVVDVTPLSRERPDLVAADGLHPSERMHRIWAELVLPAALAAVD